MPAGRFTDVGFGISAVTTHELSLAFPDREVVGVEVNGAHVETARREFPQLRFLAGDLQTLRAEPPSALIRLANVGRGLTKDAAETLHADVLPLLVEGGVCLEGSTDIEGHVSAFWVLRRRGETLSKEALVLHTDGARGFSPWLFRDVLPRELRRDVKPGTAVYALFTAWTEVWERVRTADPLESFVASANALHRPGLDVRFVGDGFVGWSPTLASG
ncbi:MAG: hypothetical protein JNM69_03520 [Archangium sp.]|nr:hypothetical protein [Archangium sp.]